MLALTQCWYTRVHVPEGRKHRQEGDSWESHCRHCQRPIVSWDRSRWFLADGFNVTRLTETTAARFFYLFDPADDFIVARFPVGHLSTEAELAAYWNELVEHHGLAEPGCDLVLCDSNGKATSFANAIGTGRAR